MSAEAVQLREAQAASGREAGLVLAWKKRRPAWTRTDTARWLNDRSEPVLAWLRRHAAQAPAHSQQMGYWLKERRQDVFDRAHTRLAAVGAGDRETLTTSEVLR